MKYLVTFAALVLAAPTGVRAGEVKLAAPFANHMVLQRDKPVPVWGWADAGDRVAVKFAGQSQAATAAADGKWLVKLAPLTASAEPRTLVVRRENRPGNVEVKDVLVGEVWLGSGQSNMAMNVARARDFEREKAAAKLPLVRMFREESGAAPAPRVDGKGSWSVCAPETVGAFSATLYFFGRELHRELGVPIGLINSSVGGTPIESWLAAEVQAATLPLKTAFETDQRAYEQFDVAQAKANHEKALARWKEQAAKAKAAGGEAPRRPVDPAEARTRRGGPGGLFNGKIAPLVPYALRGILWYQGEANARPDRAALYRHQLEALVGDWRKRWGEELPFAWVQLPNFTRDGDAWMVVREGMLQALRLPRTGMAITVDIGDPKDIHPTNKQDVGRRLALWALGTVYERKGAVSGPLPGGHEVRGAEVVLAFRHGDDGLRAKSGELKGFVVAGADRQWKPAKARIEGDKVVVACDDVKAPVAVRYAWAANPDGNLVNGQGLPASPFRTDDWPTK